MSIKWNDPQLQRAQEIGDEVFKRTPHCAYCHGPIGIGEAEVTARAVSGFLTLEQVHLIEEHVNREAQTLGVRATSVHPGCLGHIMAECV